jgi:hypothetical protein
MVDSVSMAARSGALSPAQPHGVDRNWHRCASQRRATLPVDGFEAATAARTTSAQWAHRRSGRHGGAYCAMAAAT